MVIGQTILGAFGLGHIVIVNNMATQEAMN